MDFDRLQQGYDNADTPWDAEELTEEDIDRMRGEECENEADRRSRRYDD
jgi:hypothetical protein